MPYSREIDFRQIAPRYGSKDAAFEEMCCQLTRRTLAEGAVYTRLHGAGGDGGVECFVDLPDGSQIGWQAKYVFDVNALIKQTSASLTTALQVHKTLTRYIVCFPFNLTGQTGRRGRSAYEKFSAWRETEQNRAAAGNRRLRIEAWSASDLQSLLVNGDAHGGMREYYFNERVLSEEWFATHLDLATSTAGPRYIPDFNVETDMSKWFAALGRTPAWSSESQDRVHLFRQAYERLASAVHTSRNDQMSPAWPEECHEEAQHLIDDMAPLLRLCDEVANSDDSEACRSCVERLNDILEGLQSVESQLANDLELQHGKGKAESISFRQFMAEYEVSFPAANLDETRECLLAVEALRDWFCSPAGALAFERAFVLTGSAGSGKTHGVCDIGHRRLADGMLTCIVFGSQFGGEPDPWVRLLESLDLPVTLGMDGLLDALEAAAEASGSLCLVIIDAINETRPLPYWHDRLAAVVEAVRRRASLRLSVTCRTSYVPSCVPDGLGIPVVEHRGFEGIEGYACASFFRHYDLEVPIAPILRPEYSNPLYLKLVCETARARGLHGLPSGWFGLTSAVGAFMDQKERQFALDHGIAERGDVVRSSLGAIARAIADSDSVGLPWSQAQRVVSAAAPQAGSADVVDWLVRSDLLIEDMSAANDTLGSEHIVRLAFERLGDCLIAEKLWREVTSAGINNARCPDGPLDSLLRDADAVEHNTGVLGALSIFVAEQQPGLELPDFVTDPIARTALVRITVSSFPSRDPATFSSSSRTLFLEALHVAGFSRQAMDAVLSTSWQRSAIDALWLHTVLKNHPLSRRDAWWCSYLHDRYETHGPVRRLIEAAFEFPLGQVENPVAERWATSLRWFAAAADRRVKDGATRAATALFVARPEITLGVLGRLFSCDDDEVRERALLATYGAMIVTRDPGETRRTAEWLCKTFRDNPLTFDNALIRDDARSVLELASELGVLPDDCEAQMIAEPIPVEWPLTFPSAEEMQRYRDSNRLPRLVSSCLQDDFFRYSLGDLRPWEHGVPIEKMAEWILHRVASGFGYEGSGCEQYDSYMLHKYGFGRARKTWAERIGKKYQWVAMYQLASRLHDHVRYKTEDWQPGTVKSPLVLVSQRKLDPTVPPTTHKNGQTEAAWWMRGSVDLQSARQLLNETWIVTENDLPTFQELLSVIEHDGDQWLPLVRFAQWQQTEDVTDPPSREVWISIRSHLVANGKANCAFDYLNQRNLFGRKMPETSPILYGFAGEYPWATAFKSEFAQWGRWKKEDLPCTCIPSWNELAVEWEYDASRESAEQLNVPARELFAPHDLWWNGRDGYSRISDGKTIFRDPSFTENGPSSLMTDAQDLLERLDKIGKRLIWSLIGEKYSMSSAGQVTERRSFSQVAQLQRNGLVRFGERAFFQD